jgi:hypothetical protein
MTTEFTIERTFGELLLRSRMKWEEGPNTSRDCLGKLTFIHLKALRPDGTHVYIKLSPEIVNGNQGWGDTTVISPSWDTFLCDSSSKFSRCLSGEEARNISFADLQYVDFEVVTNATIASSESIQPIQKSVQDKPHSTMSAYERLLQELDGKGNRTPASLDESSEIVEEKAAPIPPPSVIDPRIRAEEATREIASLISSSLAQYITAPHECESERVISNWVRTISTCQINFRRESQHEFLCGGNDEARSIQTESELSVDFSRHVDEITEVRNPDEPWSSVILRLKEKLGHITSNDYKVDRWQFTGANHVSSDIELLAQNFIVLKEYCESNI